MPSPSAIANIEPAAPVNLSVEAFNQSDIANIRPIITNIQSDIDKIQPDIPNIGLNPANIERDFINI